MAESTKNSRGRASSNKNSSVKKSVRTTSKAPAKSTSVAKSNNSPETEVVVHKTSSNPTPAWKEKSIAALSATLKTLRQRSFWLWVGGIIAALLIVLIAWWQWQRSYVAVVNGQYVPTTTLYSQLMASGGSETINNLIQQQLILQQAQREKVTVTKDEIQQDLDEFKTSAGGDEEYQSSLKEFGISEELLRNQIEVRLTLEKILADKIKVSEKEIEDYYNANKAEVDVANEGLEAASERIEMQLSEQKLSQESSRYVESLQQGSTIKSLPHHTSLTFKQFLMDEILTIPQEVWNLLTGKTS